MILGAGIDFMSDEQLASYDGKWDDPFFIRTFTPAEIEESAGRGAERLIYLSGRFCAKEAVVKALAGLAPSARFNEVETLSDEMGAPHAKLLGRLAEDVCASVPEGVQIFVSISHEKGFSVAYAVVERA